jgi:hypothetical protein
LGCILIICVHDSTFPLLPLMRLRRAGSAEPAIALLGLFCGSSEQALVWFKRTKHEHTGIAVAAYRGPRVQTNRT